MTARTVCGCTPPNVPPSPRNNMAIASDLCTVARAIISLSDAVADRTLTANTLADADIISIGYHRLLCELCELRALHHAQGGSHD